MRSTASACCPEEPKPPPPVGDFSYVEVVGCLTAGPAEHVDADPCERAGRGASSGAIDASRRRDAARHGDVSPAGCDGLRARGPQGPQDLRPRFVDQAARRAAHDDQRVRDGVANLQRLTRSPSTTCGRRGSRISRAPSRPALSGRCAGRPAPAGNAPAQDRARAVWHAAAPGSLLCTASASESRMPSSRRPFASLRSSATARLSSASTRAQIGGGDAAGWPFQRLIA